MNCTTKRKAVIEVAKKAKDNEENLKNTSTAEEQSAVDENIEAQGMEQQEQAGKDYDVLEKKYSELEDKYYRLAAEYTNFQRRSREEKEAMYTNAVSDTVAELLPILDNLQRAMDTPAETKEAKTIADGVAMIAKLAVDTFAKLGVEPIEAVGKEFDAAVHNAVMHVDDDSFGKNEVVEEFQKGYKCKDKVIRYSMVKVAN